MSEATNIRVWARRFNVEISDLGRASQAAEKAYGAGSRRGAIYVVAMKAASVKFGLAMGSNEARAVAQGIANVCYDAAYGDGKNSYSVYRDTNIQLEKAGYGIDVLILMGELEQAAVALALDAIAVRTKERTRAGSSIVNAILAKARK